MNIKSTEEKLQTLIDDVLEKLSGLERVQLGTKRAFESDFAIEGELSSKRSCSTQAPLTHVATPSSSRVSLSGNECAAGSSIYSTSQKPSPDVQVRLNDCVK